MRRRWNAARLDAYLSALAPLGEDAPTLPPGSEAEHEPGEAAMLALRTSGGLPRSALDNPRHGATLRWAIAAGLLGDAEGRLVLNRRGRLLSNEVFARLI